MNDVACPLHSRWSSVTFNEIYCFSNACRYISIHLLALPLSPCRSPVLFWSHAHWSLWINCTLLAILWMNLLLHDKWSENYLNARIRKRKWRGNNYANNANGFRSRNLTNDGELSAISCSNNSKWTRQSQLPCERQNCFHSVVML